jgi:hypothetical protein
LAAVHSEQGQSSIWVGLQLIDLNNFGVIWRNQLNLSQILTAQNSRNAVEEYFILANLQPCLIALNPGVKKYESPSFMLVKPGGYKERKRQNRVALLKLERIGTCI